MPGNQLSRVCPVCAQGGFVEALRKEDLRLVRCLQCGMIYTNPIDTGWASGLSYDKLARPYYLSPDKLESDYTPVRFERELKLFRRFCERGSVLDVGCSTGAFLFQLKTRFADAYEVLGVDVAGPALDYAEKMGVPVLRESFLSHHFGRKRFSAITFWAVLEHLAKPAEFLNQAAALLEPGGLCFVLVPNHRSLAVRLLGARYRYIFPQHVNYFTRATLKALAKTTPRLRVVKHFSTHFNPLVLWQDWRSGKGFVPDEQRAQLLKRTTAYKRNPALKPVKLFLALAEAALATINLADNLVVVLQAK
jgi:2-polyprenyl-3-methyl-5-hydroxy-6-metoxy-1,4-benzoquinol methylase